MLIIVFIGALIAMIVFMDYDMNKNFYNRKLSLQLELYYDRKREVVWLDFKSFKSLFKLSPESWQLQDSLFENLKHIQKDNSKEHFILFKKEKDYKKAIALFKEYQEDKKERWTAEKEIRDFESFKEVIQSEINQKKKDAEREIEEANRLLNNLKER